MDDDFDLIGAALTESGIDLDEESFVSSFSMWMKNTLYWC